MSGIKFQGCVKSFSSDEDGQCKLTFEIPATEHAKVAAISMMTKRVLNIDVHVDESLNEMSEETEKQQSEEQVEQ